MNTRSPSLWAIMRGPMSYTYTLLRQKGISLLIRVTSCPCGLEHIFWNILLLLGLGFPTVPIYLYLLLQWLFYLNLKLSLILVFSVHYTLVSELLYDFLSLFVKPFHFLTSYSTGQWFLSQPPLQLPWPRSPLSCWSLNTRGYTQPSSYLTMQDCCPSSQNALAWLTSSFLPLVFCWPLKCCCSWVLFWALWFFLCLIHLGESYVMSTFGCFGRLCI